MTPKGKIRKIAAPLILLPEGAVKNSYLVFAADGSLTEVERDVASIDTVPGLEYYNGILIPGMVNAHLHLELSHLEGAIPAGSGLPYFAENIGKLRDTLSPSEQIRAAEVFDAQMYSEGVSASGDVSNSDISFAVKHKSKILYHTYIECFGLDESKASSIIARAERLADKSRGKGLAASLTPHSTYSCSDELFAGLSSSSEMLSVHFMESRAEEDIFKGTGGFAPWYSRIVSPENFSDYGSPLEKLAALIPSNKKLSLIHNTFVTGGDAELLSAKFPHLTFVVCPLSNKYIEGTSPDYLALASSGANIALGTDSLASSGTRSMTEILKHMVLHESIGMETAIRWATIGGAKALGMESRLGTFESGKTPGAVLITGIDWENTSLTGQSASRRII